MRDENGENEVTKDRKVGELPKDFRQLHQVLRLQNSGLPGLDLDLRAHDGDSLDDDAYISFR